MEKMTYGKALAIAIEAVEEGKVREKLVALKDSLARKSSGERKPTATQKENEILRGKILDFMESEVDYTIGDISKGIKALGDCSNQKVSALVKQLRDCGKVERVEIKRKAYYHKVEA